MKEPNWYIIYDDRTDEIKAIGTYRECAEQMGWKYPNHFWKQLNMQKKREQGIWEGNRNISIYRIEDDEDE